MPSDQFTLPVTTASPRALDAYDRAVHGLLGWDGAALDMFNRALAIDPGLALAHAGAAVCYFLDERFPEARASAEQARAAVTGATPRERGHVEAMAQLVTGRPDQAEQAMREHLASYPRDLAVFQRLYYIWFWQGRFPEMLAMTSQLARHYPGNSFMLGLHAFALEEAHRIPEAFATAEVAVARNPRDAWAVHALAHTVYEMGASRAGTSLLPPAIHPCTHLGWFRNHLVWHLALMHFASGDYTEGQHDGPGRLRAPPLVDRGEPPRLHLAPLAARARRGQRRRALAAVRGHRPRSLGSTGAPLPRGSSGDGSGRGRRMGDRGAAARHAPRARSQGPHGAGGHAPDPAGGRVFTPLRLETTAVSSRRSSRCAHGSWSSGAAVPSAMSFTTRFSRRASVRATRDAPGGGWRSAWPGDPTPTGSPARNRPGECSPSDDSPAHGLNVMVRE